MCACVCVCVCVCTGVCVCVCVCVCARARARVVHLYCSAQLSMFSMESATEIKSLLLSKCQCPSNMQLVYLRDGSAQTTGLAATLR